MSTTRIKPDRTGVSRAGVCPLPPEYWDASGSRKKCTKSASREVQHPIGAFVCAECGRSLVPARKRPRFPVPLAAAAIVVLLIVAAAGTYLFWPSKPTLVCSSRTPGGNTERIRALVDSKPSTPDLMQAASQCAEINILDATMLLREASDRGDATAARKLGEIYDPIDVEGRKQQISPPVPRNAATFYLTARRNGDPQACERLGQLLTWSRNQALAGNADARQVQAVLEGSRAC